jgi:hypothetical protein
MGKNGCRVFTHCSCVNINLANNGAAHNMGAGGALDSNLESVK